MSKPNNNYAQTVLDWILTKVQPGTKETLVIGINAPQGAGKTTLCNQLVLELSKLKLHTVCISVDDFYLTNAQQQQLANKHPKNPFLEHRGYPGTHDIELGTTTLKALTQGAGSIPRYDKSAFNGRGDRFPKELWTKVANKPDIILFEGWMLGYQKQPEVTQDLQPSNDFLPSYKSWTDEVHHNLIIYCKNKSIVKTWRLQAEQNARLAGKPTLSNEEISDYISRFIKAYEVYQDPLIKKLSSFPDSLILEIDENRPLLKKD